MGFYSVNSSPGATSFLCHSLAGHILPTQCLPMQIPSHPSVCLGLARLATQSHQLACLRQTKVSHELLRPSSSRLLQKDTQLSTPLHLHLSVLLVWVPSPLPLSDLAPSQLPSVPRPRVPPGTTPLLELFLETPVYTLHRQPTGALVRFLQKPWGMFPAHLAFHASETEMMCATKSH